MSKKLIAVIAAIAAVVVVVVLVLVLRPAPIEPRLAAAFAQIFPHAGFKAMNGYYEVIENREVIGYAATAQGMGAKGPIELALG
jgi:hypothetical protein